jgi:hypothetical protein
VTVGRRVALALAVAVLCVAGTSGASSSPQRPVAVALGGMLILAATSRPDPAPPTVSTAGLAGWAGLLAAVVAFQVASYVQSPRETYPTVSSLINLVFAHHAVRAAGFAAWLALGWYLLRR